MRIARHAPALTLVASLIAGPALAQDWPATSVACAGAYGALAQEVPAQVLWAPNFGNGTNLTTIDWGARRQSLLKASPEIAREAATYEENFRQMLRKDRIDNIAKGTGVVIELSMRCDQTFGNSPSFVIPPKR